MTKRGVTVLISWVLPLATRRADSIIFDTYNYLVLQGRSRSASSTSRPSRPTISRSAPLPYRWGTPRTIPPAPTPSLIKCVSRTTMTTTTTTMSTFMTP
jgi:hypothetical protein